MTTQTFPAVALLVAVSIASCVDAACPNDWVNYEGSCYAIVDELVTWATANITFSLVIALVVCAILQICRSLHSQLVEVTSQAENNFVASQLRNRQLSSTWIGLNDFLREGRWVIPSSQEVQTFFKWNPGEPNNSHSHAEGGEDCVILYANNGGWDDYWCDDTHHSAVVCEMDAEEESVVG